MPCGGKRCYFRNVVAGSGSAAVAAYVTAAAVRVAPRSKWRPWVSAAAEWGESTAALRRCSSWLEIGAHELAHTGGGAAELPVPKRRQAQAPGLPIAGWPEADKRRPARLPRISRRGGFQ